MSPQEPDSYSEVTEAVALAIQRYVKGEGDFDLDIQSLKLKLYFKGPKWMGVVDRPVAEFLLDLNKRLEEELTKRGVEIPKFDRGIVAIGVKEGSFDSFLMVVPDAAEYLMQLEPVKKVLAVTTVMVAAGAWKVIRRRVPKREDMSVRANRRNRGKSCEDRKASKGSADEGHRATG